MIHLAANFVVIASLLQSPAPASQAAPQLPRVTDEVVVTATAAPVPAEQVARAVTVLRREDLDRLGITSVIEALRLVPGLDPRARGPRDVQTDFSVRGATFGQSLVLVDGMRLNDSQSGHHNGDIPVPMMGIDRIEVVGGAGSAVHGADALGGTINFIGRSDRHAAASVSAGQYGTVDFQASTSGGALPVGWTATGWAGHTDGFTFDRDDTLGGVLVRGPIARGMTVDVRHLRKAFGANGFYGVSPSKEWTDQTVGSLDWTHVRGVWTSDLRGDFRNHGDHFRWDINRPGFAENRHRTNAAAFDARFDRSLGDGRRVTFGSTTGGDWIRSSNLGDHSYWRASGFTELLLPVGSRSVVQGGLRYDYYGGSATPATGNTGFGGSWSPSLSAGTWITSSVRLRASVAHAFRIPTFTELYYHDPANLGTPTLTAERGWSADGGLDWRRGAWTLSVSPFARWDQDVIDWIKSQPQDLWRSTNVRDVSTTGVETAVMYRWQTGFVRGFYTGLSVDAPTLDVLSKYVLEYARTSTGVSASLPLGAGWRATSTIDHRHRRDGQSYELVQARVSKSIARVELFVLGTNLLNEQYHEVAGVEMPGRWGMAGVAIR